MSLKILGPWLALVTASAVILGPAWLVVTLPLSGVIYYLSLVVHPNRDCWACRGSGQHRGALFTYARRPCTNCAGTGIKPRFGRRLFFS